MSNPQPQFILASASPRRKELLEQIGARFEVISVDIDERPKMNEAAEDYVQRVAREKAEAGRRRRMKENLPVLAADTSVVVDGTILGKPTNAEHAFTMLQLLSGRRHHVFSAVCLYGDSQEIVLNKTEVSFRTLDPSEIEAYWHTGEPCDKAGSYAIQGMGALFVSTINGSFSGVVGLPLFETAQLLKNQGIHILNE